MSDRLHVATRKGLFIFEPSGGGWRPVSTYFLGEPVTMILPDARDGVLYAALNLGHFGVKLHRSPDGGTTWETCAVPAYPKSDDEKSPALKQIWCLEAGGKSEPGVIWAGTIPGGLFRSGNKGTSWEMVASLWERPEREQWMGGGYDHPGIHSLVVDGNRLGAGVSVGGYWRSEDGGASWTLGGKGMYAEYMPPERRDDPAIQDPHRLVASPSSPDVLWCQHHNGAFRSTDGGKTFAEVHPLPSKFGFAVAVHPKDPDTAWYVPAVKDECRVPVDGKIVVSRTRDGGKRFEVLSKGLPQEHAYDLVYRHALDVDSTGTRLAMGSTTGSLWATEDAGDSWRTVNAHLPPVYCVRFGG